MPNIPGLEDIEPVLWSKDGVEIREGTLGLLTWLPGIGGKGLLPGLCKCASQLESPVTRLVETLCTYMALPW